MNSYALHGKVIARAPDCRRLLTSKNTVYLRMGIVFSNWLISSVLTDWSQSIYLTLLWWDHLNDRNEAETCAISIKYIWFNLSLESGRFNDHYAMIWFCGQRSRITAVAAAAATARGRIRIVKYIFFVCIFAHSHFSSFSLTHSFLFFLRRFGNIEMRGQATQASVSVKPRDYLLFHFGQNIKKPNN